MASNTLKLKNKIIKVLTAQGFKINPHIRPARITKSNLKKIQGYARKEQISLHRRFLLDNADKVAKHIINGKDIDLDRIDLEIREIDSDSKDEMFFKWWNLIWWSIPYQRAYGRQMRFLIWDKGHDAPFGLIGLQSPILKMAVRDDYLNIPTEEIDLWVNKSMQAQRLGALPPYNEILGGKMVALTLTANELRKAYKNKYKNSRTILENRIIEPDLLFITTTSAFGRSSIYNRLRYDNTLVAESLGYTKGYGTFQIPQELYQEIRDYLIKQGINVETTFGNGPSRKIKLLTQAFSLLGLGKYTNHNIKREFFIFPLAKNLQNVVTHNVKPKYYNRKFNELAEFWMDRWAKPRSIRNQEWKDFNSKGFLKKALKEITN